LCLQFAPAAALFTLNPFMEHRFSLPRKRDIFQNFCHVKVPQSLTQQPALLTVDIHGRRTYGTSYMPCFYNCNSRFTSLYVPDNVKTEPRCD